MFAATVSRAIAAYSLTLEVQTRSFEGTVERCEYFQTSRDRAMSDRRS